VPTNERLMFSQSNAWKERSETEEMNSSSGGGAKRPGVMWVVGGPRVVKEKETGGCPLVNG